MKKFLIYTLMLISGAAVAKEIKPNVVIFFTDDQGTLDANCYGSTDLYTPTIDKLANEGVRFTQAYAHTVCCPARAMLLTGRHPQRSGIINWTQGNMNQKDKGRNMPLSEITLAEVLKGAGYKTALFGKWHLGSHKDHGPMKQGFDEFFGLRGGFIDNYNHHFLHGKGFYDLYEGTKQVFHRGKYFPDMTTTRAVKFIEENKKNPFFVYVAFNIPHYPEQPDKKFDQRYEKLEEPRRSYAKMVSTTDDRMGVVLKKLEELGLRENTIVIYMSDNGHSTEHITIRYDDHLSGLKKGTNYCANGGGGNTGKWLGAKKSFLEGGVRVPAIISYSKLPSNIVRDQAITAMDWMPTILDLCSVTLPKVKLDGKSILPVIKSATAKSHNTVMHWGWSGEWMTRRGPWKLLGAGEKVTQLVNLNDAQPERKNYLSENPALAKELHDLQIEWAEETVLK